MGTVSIELPVGGDTTLVVHGPPDDTRTLVLAHDAGAVEEGSTLVRALHAATSAEAVTVSAVYEGEGEDVELATIATALGYGEVSAWTAVDAAFDSLAVDADVDGVPEWALMAKGLPGPIVLVAVGAGDEVGLLALGPSFGMSWGQPWP